MSSPTPRYALHRLTGQFQEPAREASYRREIAPRVRLESSVAICVAALVFGMFAISDYHYLDAGIELTLLLTMRLVVVVACLALAVAIGVDFAEDRFCELPRRRSERGFEATILRKTMDPHSIQGRREPSRARRPEKLY